MQLPQGCNTKMVSILENINYGGRDLAQEKGINMLENKAIRRINAQLLLDTLYNSNKSEMARALTKHYSGTVAPSTVRRWFFDGEDARNIGSNMARLIERAADKPVGWLDVKEGEGKQWHLDEYKKVPILGAAYCPRGEAWHTLDINSLNNDNGANGYVNVPQENPEVFAIEILGSCYSPAIRAGWFIVANPATQPTAGDLVTVRLKNDKISIREFLWHHTPFYTLATINDDGKREEIDDDEVYRINVITNIIPASQRAS